jgi:Mg2+ and Co2+ transporter CorA
MNVNFPFEAKVAAFWGIIGGMVVVLVSMVAYFRSRGWL